MKAILPEAIASALSQSGAIFKLTEVQRECLTDLATPVDVDSDGEADGLAERSIPADIDANASESIPSTCVRSRKEVRSVR